MKFQWGDDVSRQSDVYIPFQLRKQPRCMFKVLVEEMVTRVGKARARSAVTISAKDKKRKRVNVATFDLSGELFWELQASGQASVALESGRLRLQQQFVELTGDPECVKGKSAGEDMTLVEPQVVSLGKAGGLRFTTPRELIKTSGNESVLTKAGSGPKGHKKTTKQPIKKRQKKRR